MEFPLLVVLAQYKVQCGGDECDAAYSAGVQGSTTAFRSSVTRNGNFRPFTSTRSFTLCHDIGRWRKSKHVDPLPIKRSPRQRDQLRISPISPGLTFPACAASKGAVAHLTSGFNIAHLQLNL